MISLFYQAWEKYRFPVAYERGERDRFSHHLLDLIGLGHAGLAEPPGGAATIRCCSMRACCRMQPRSAAALRADSGGLFDVPVEVEQFVGAWHALDEPNQCCFDAAMTYSEQLGVGAVVGDEIWDQQSRVRIKLGR